MHTARHLAVILVGAVVLGAAGMGMAQTPPPSDASNAVLQAMLAVEHDFIQQNAQLKHAGATLKAAASGAHADQAALHAIDDNARLRWENVMLKAKGQPDRTQALAQIQQDIAQLRQENAALLQGNDQLTAALQNPPPQQASDSDNYVQDPPADPVQPDYSYASPSCYYGSGPQYPWYSSCRYYHCGCGSHHCHPFCPCSGCAYSCSCNGCYVSGSRSFSTCSIGSTGSFGCSIGAGAFGTGSFGRSIGAGSFGGSRGFSAVADIGNVKHQITSTRHQTNSKTNDRDSALLPNSCLGNVPEHCGIILHTTGPAPMGQKRVAGGVSLRWKA